MGNALSGTSSSCAANDIPMRSTASGVLAAVFPAANVTLRASGPGSFPSSSAAVVTGNFEINIAATSTL